jgi:hypothetical protein
MAPGPTPRPSAHGSKNLTSAKPATAPGAKVTSEYGTNRVHFALMSVLVECSENRYAGQDKPAESRSQKAQAAMARRRYQRPAVKQVGSGATARWIIRFREDVVNGTGRRVRVCRKQQIGKCSDMTRAMAQRAADELLSKGANNPTFQPSTTITFSEFVETKLRPGAFAGRKAGGRVTAESPETSPDPVVRGNAPRGDQIRSGAADGIVTDRAQAGDCSDSRYMWNALGRVHMGEALGVPGRIQSQRSHPAQAAKGKKGEALHSGRDPAHHRGGRAFLRSNLPYAVRSCIAARRGYGPPG